MTDMELAVSEAEPQTDQDNLPIRMLNEYTYCPRLFHLMHVEGRWEDNEFTLEGKQAHRRVDRIDQLLPDPEAPAPAGTKRSRASGVEDGDAPPEVSRSVSLTAPSLGITGKLDLVSTAGD
jgi:CRISPR-associated protein Cas1